MPSHLLCAQEGPWQLPAIAVCVLGSRSPVVSLEGLSKLYRPPISVPSTACKAFFATPLGHLNRKGPHSAMHAHVQGIMVYGAPTRCLMVPPWEQ